MNIKSCSRCGGDHDFLNLTKLMRPFAPPECAPIVWTHWTQCPTNGDPILVSMLPGSDPALHAEVLSGQQAFDAALPIVYQIFVERRTKNARAAIGPSSDDEPKAFESTLREFFGKWKPSTGG